jgi:hypothetical protein
LEEVVTLSKNGVEPPRYKSGVKPPQSIRVETLSAGATYQRQFFSYSSFAN